MKAKALDRWTRMRALGFWWFVLVCGVMGYGMTMAVFMLVLLEWLPLEHSHSQISHPITKLACFCGVAGFVWGLSSWIFAERQYHRHRTSPGFDVVQRSG